MICSNSLRALEAHLNQVGLAHIQGVNMPLALISAADASYYTGRPVGTIWRWASEGRISRHGHGKGARYDVRELPGKTVDELTGEVCLGDPPSLPEGLKAA